MSQILHIFKKDARHLWPEVLASLVLTAIFARIYPHGWAHEYETSRLSDITRSVVTVLVPISWWLMVTRLVHGESLVGDRQFWVTRPYQWPKLLASKFLFLAVFLYLPILTAHSVLLREAGFRLFFYLPGLLFNLLLITLILIVPIMAIATVTSGFAKAVLTLLAVIGGLVGMAALSSLWNSSNPDTFGDIIFPIVLCSLTICTILVQYSTRNVRLSRWLLVAATVLGSLSAIPWLEEPFVRIEYPALSANTLPPAHLEFDSSRQPTAFGVNDQKELTVGFPIMVSSVPTGTAVRAEGVMVAISAPNGLHWSSFWQSGGQYLTPSTATSMVDIKVNRAFLEKVKDVPVRVQITLAVSRLRAGATGEATLRREEFVIPDGGICSLQSNEFSSSATCRFAMRQPRLTNFSSMWSRQPCSRAQSAGNTFVPASGWMGSLDKAPADFGITSVWASSLYFPGEGWASPRERTFLCPGTAISFTEYSLMDRARINLVIPAIRLPYKVEPSVINFSSDN
jgi:hypothetical protein